MIVLPTLPMAAAEVCALVSPSDGLMYGRSGAAANVLKKVAKNEAQEMWNAHMCGCAKEKTLMKVALCSPTGAISRRSG